MRTFVIGDIHGSHKALIQCFERAGFDKGRDRLICLGDAGDRGANTRECIDELLGVRSFVYILGNHDSWVLDWAIRGEAPDIWLEQGGRETIASYGSGGMPKEHIELLSGAPLWLVEANRLFVHAGFDPEAGLERTSREALVWDRELLSMAEELHRSAADYKFGGYDDIFIGHTPTLKFGDDTPKRFCNVWAMDTGAGWGGRLTIMDVETKEYWQSDRLISGT